MGHDDIPVFDKNGKRKIKKKKKEINSSTINLTINEKDSIPTSPERVHENIILSENFKTQQSGEMRTNTGTTQLGVLSNRIFTISHDTSPDRVTENQGHESKRSTASKIWEKRQKKILEKEKEKIQDQQREAKIMA